MKSIENYKSFGMRTSSLLSLYPHFSSYADSISDGELRYIEHKNVVGVANEPLTQEEQKDILLQKFFTETRFKNKDKLIFPISKTFAEKLVDHGLHIWQIGSEPIFDLQRYFKEQDDPLDKLPIAKTLKRRGAMVYEISASEVTQYQEDFEDIRSQWLAQKDINQLSFLNQVAPDIFWELKRFFILKDKNQVMAYLTACPVYSNKKIIAYFFNDILKRKNARSGSCELLIIEAMRILYQEGTAEVRLGMCPLADIDPHERDADHLQKIFSSWKLGYNFKNLYTFKSKLQPTQMQPLYLASNNPHFHKMITNTIKLHLPDGWLTEVLKRFWYKNKGSLKIKNELQSFRLPLSLKLSTFLYRTKCSWCLVFVFILLHLLKINTQSFFSIFKNSAYVPSDVTWSGLFLGPVFHNHAFHLIGDQLSFLLLALLIEYTFGAGLLLFITAVGLWISNPFTHLTLALILPNISSDWWNSVLFEKDYGTSNAVFALVGTAVFVLKRYLWILLPFLISGIYLCVTKTSFLALHHPLSILLGYLATRLYFRRM